MGTRLFPFTKELPKEMAPVFFPNNGKIQTVPLIQLIYESLYNQGIREFCFVTGKTKRSIENHFTIDSSNYSDMSSFFEKLNNSKIFWITQNKPKGFGDALKYAESFIGKSRFILHAGDVAMIDQSNTIKKMIQNKDDNIDVMLHVRNVKEPKRHGIVELDSNGIDVVRVEEKPEIPKSTLGIMPIYLFKESIFEALNSISPGKNDEIQVTDAIQYLIELDKKVKATKVDNEIFWDVGTPESYWESLQESYKFCEIK